MFRHNDTYRDKISEAMLSKDEVASLYDCVGLMLFL